MNKNVHVGHIRRFGDDGWGSIDGRAEVIDFHATAIADGARTISVGTRVHYRRRPGLSGRWEALDVTPI